MNLSDQAKRNMVIIKAVYANGMYTDEVLSFITYSAVILYADWSIGVIPGAAHTL